jgi:hypothetical protein
MSILPPKGIFLGHLVFIWCSFGNFFPFWYGVPKKIWQPWCVGFEEASPQKVKCKFGGHVQHLQFRVCGRIIFVSLVYNKKLVTAGYSYSLYLL